MCRAKTAGIYQNGLVCAAVGAVFLHFGWTELGEVCFDYATMKVIMKELIDSVEI